MPAVRHAVTAREGIGGVGHQKPHRNDGGVVEAVAGVDREAESAGKTLKFKRVAQHKAGKGQFPPDEFATVGGDSQNR